ncbi:MAG: putative DNA binding domain-containing protein [Endomicrobium sp.]|jgi:predicted HTH transcriptional regulator|nr:putative DNA binding domain-containing protein [Endomicrobium sp.]
MKHETNRIEYKEKLTGDLEKEVVAFLNFKGGDIYIGIKNDGSSVGVKNPDDIQLKIKDRLINNIRPSIMGLFNISTQERDGKIIIVVNIPSGAETPYYIKQKGRSESGCFIRIGNSAHPLTEDVINSMMARRYRYCLISVPARRQDLTFTQLGIYYAGKHKTLNKHFASNFNFYTEDKKYNELAYMFADENRVSIRLAKWAGKDKSNLLQNEEYGDQCLITALNKVLDRLDTENITQAKKTYPLRVEKRYVDKEALREAVINAFVHNNYSNGNTPIFEIYEDRFEITTYGDLLSWIDKEDFFTGKSKPRNPEIMRIFRDLEFVEYLGSGIPYIVELYGRDVFHFSKTVTKIVLKFDKSIEKEILKKTTPKTDLKTVVKTVDKTVVKIIKAIKEKPSITVKELANLLSLTRRGVEYNLSKLKEQNKICRVGPDKSGHWEVVE